MPLPREPAPDSEVIEGIVALFARGRYDEAARAAQSLIRRFPLHGFGHKALGAILQQVGRNADALAPLQRAAQLLPEEADALSNLGNALRFLGQLDDAAARYRQALAIKPNFAEAHCNLSNILRDIGKGDEAMASCRRALAINPLFAEAYRVLSLLLHAQNRYAEALAAIGQSLQLKETAEAKSIFVACARRLQITGKDGNIRASMIRALTEPWGRPNDLVGMGISVVKANAEFAACLSRSSGAWPNRLSAHDLFGNHGLESLANDSLLHAILISAPICDTGVERFLTMVRRIMLAEAMAHPMLEEGFEATLRFYSALARQCFINEYVYALGDEEVKEATDLRRALSSALAANARVSALCLTAVAAYFPLHTVPHSSRLLDVTWPESIMALLVEQIREPLEEEQLRTGIARITVIDDRTSLLVKNQYEEHPYPRWVKTAPAGKRLGVDEYLRQTFPLACFGIHRREGTTQVLIAGCGTGQHAVGVGQRYDEARITAIDLSMSSLAYAKRKMGELGLASIEYAQADILRLGATGRTFDVIESVGVLHHLADPWTGWKVLLSRLRPGGFMKLGLYSAVARREIAKARSLIAVRGYGASNDEIRRCRQELLVLDSKHSGFGSITGTADFFCTSTCRDLLFHVQERHLTLAAISAFLRENDLTFLGFEIEASVLQAYRRRFPDDLAAVDLNLWQTFEAENNDTFAHMYQFWIQKADAARQGGDHS